MWHTSNQPDPNPRKLPFIAGGAEGDADEPNPNEPDGGEGTPPQFVSTEEFKQFREEQARQSTALTEAINAMRSAVEASNRPREVVREEPRREAAPVVTREEYVEAVQNGDIKKVEQYEAQQEARVAARLNQLESTGTSAIAELNKRTEVGSLPYYTRFKKDIDTLVESLPPHLKMSAGVYKYAHDKIVGEHVQEIIAEEREAALRKPTTDEPIDRVPAGRSGRETGRETSRVPSPRDLGGQEVEDALAFRGMDADTQARKLGYKSWADYMDKTKEYR